MPVLDCKYTIKKKYPDLSIQEKKIADYVLANIDQVFGINVEKLAKCSSTSLSTVVRFVRHLGYDSFQHFRIAMIRENIINENRVFEVPVEKGQDTVSTVFNSAIKTLQQTQQVLNRDDLKEAAVLIKDARRVCLFGMGGSNVIAYNAYHRLIRLGLNCIFINDFHNQLINASQMSDCDVAVIFSHTGVDIDAIAIRDEAKKHNAKTICINSGPNTPVAEGCDIVISATPNLETFVPESYSARMAYLAIIDTIYLELIISMGETGEKNLEKMREAMARRSL